VGKLIAEANAAKNHEACNLPIFCLSQIALHVGSRLSRMCQKICECVKPMMMHVTRFDGECNEPAVDLAESCLNCVETMLKTMPDEMNPHW